MQYIILTSEGDFEQVSFPGKLEGKKIDFDPLIIDCLQAAKAQWVRGLVTMPGHFPLSVCYANHLFTCSFRLKYLKLKANFKAVEIAGKKIVLPAWGDTQEPELVLNWTPPAGMELRLGIECYPDAGTVKMARVFLVAFSMPNKDAFKLPLPNLYDDCHICLPFEIQVRFSTILECVTYAAELVANSPWNSHLIRDAGEVLQSVKMFRFLPDNAGFLSEEPEAPWKTLCKTVGTATLEWMLP